MPEAEFEAHMARTKDADQELTSASVRRLAEKIAREKRWAAESLGVSQGTLRNWGRDGKIATHRHPINDYRLYKKAELEALLKEIERSADPDAMRGS